PALSPLEPLRASSGPSRYRVACALFVGALAPRPQAKIEVARFEWILILAQSRIVRRQRHRELGRQAAVEQARALQLVEPRQVADRIEPEMRQERFGRAIGQRTAWRLAAAARPDPPGLQQDVNRALGRRHAANLLDLGARDRLVIGNDRERLDRRPRQLAGLHCLLAEQPGQVSGGAERPFAANAPPIGPARRIFLLPPDQSRTHDDPLREAGPKLLLGERLGGGDQHRLEEPKLLRARARIARVVLRFIVRFPYLHLCQAHGHGPPSPLVLQFFVPPVSGATSRSTSSPPTDG